MSISLNSLANAAQDVVDAGLSGLRSFAGITPQSVGLPQASFAAAPTVLSAASQAYINGLSPGFGDAVAAALPVAAIGGAIGPGHLPAGPFGAIYAFGDSLTDGGNAFIGTAGTTPPSPPYDGHFSNGPVWVQDLAKAEGINNFLPSLAGGTDFAIGGAETGATVAHAATPIDLPTQLDIYRTLVPKPSSNALYAMWIGSNDAFSAASLSATDPGGALIAVNQAVINESNYIRQLAAAGAHNVVVLDVPDLGKTPAAIAHGAAGVDAASAFAAIYDTELSGSLHQVAQQNPGLNIDFVDTFGLVDQAVASPGAFGLTNVTTPAYSGTYKAGSTGVVTPGSDHYLFWDSLHPTGYAHSLVAAAVQQSLTPAA
jgi:phospholipase/lecithinase/hemolysin